VPVLFFSKELLADGVQVFQYGLPFLLGCPEYDHVIHHSILRHRMSVQQEFLDTDEGLAGGDVSRSQEDNGLV
jgi:hypothetical protein